MGKWQQSRPMLDWYWPTIILVEYQSIQGENAPICNSSTSYPWSSSGGHYAWGGSGLVTNSIIFCWLKIKDRCKKVHFKSRCQLFLTVSWDLRAQRGIPDGVLCISVVPEARTRRVEGPGRAPCQLKRPFKGLRQRRGSCKEELQRTVFPQRGDIALPFRQINDFLQKRNERKSSKWPDLRRVKALAIRFPCWGPPTWNSGMNGMKMEHWIAQRGPCFSNFGNSKKNMCVFNKRKIKVWVSFIWVLRA